MRIYICIAQLQLRAHVHVHVHVHARACMYSSMGGHPRHIPYYAPVCAVYAILLCMYIHLDLNVNVMNSTLFMLLPTRHVRVWCTIELRRVMHGAVCGGTRTGAHHGMPGALS